MAGQLRRLGEFCSQTEMEQNQLEEYEHNLAACYEAEYLLSLKIQEEMYNVNGLCRNQGYCYEDSSEVQSSPPAAVCQAARGELQMKQPVPGECSSFSRGANGYHISGFIMDHSPVPQQLGSQTVSHPATSQPTQSCTDMDFTSYGHTQTTTPLFQAQSTTHCSQYLSQNTGYSFAHAAQEYSTRPTATTDQHYKYDGIHREGPQTKRHRPEY